MDYPKGVKVIKNKDYRYDNRGMILEEDLNLTNQYYINNKIAYIYKRPTPIQVTKTEYRNNKKIIKEAFFKESSTTDYNGLYKGIYIDFEAKETKSKTSFPLGNIHDHQIKHLTNVLDNGGLAFFIIRFTSLNKTFLLTAKDFIEYFKDSKRKSIPLTYFVEKAHLIKESYNIRLDYIKIVDTLLGGTNE